MININEHGLFLSLQMREKYRDDYWENKDPICNERLLWRAQTFRHMVHLLPYHTILEIGCGKGLFTKHLINISRGENEIVTVTFSHENRNNFENNSKVDFIKLSTFPGALKAREFDFVICYDLLDESNSDYLLSNIFNLLKPGGKAVLFESNPLNPYLKIRRFILSLVNNTDPRKLIPRNRLDKLFTDFGFTGVDALYTDFVYSPVPHRLIWAFRNISTILENMPFIKTFSGALVIITQKPPVNKVMKRISLYEHDFLRKAISVVIPCHNEEMNIEPLVSQLICLYHDYLFEIIIVDDNSTDKSREIIKDLTSKNPLIKPILRDPPNGVGLALSDGYKVATGKYVLSMDCDFVQILPELRDIFDAAAKGYDVIIGSRFSRNSVLLNYPFNKIIANRGFHLLAQILLLRRFRDLTNNLKLMKKNVVDEFNLTQAGFAVNAETGLQPLIKGYSVKEIPISWINRTTDMGVSTFRLVEFGGGYIKVLLKVVFLRFFRS